MRILISFSLLLFIFSPSLRADKRKLEEYISKEEILKNIDRYRISMPRKMGYKNSKIWDTLLEYVAEKEDRTLFKTLISQLQVKPEARSEYRRDLFKILEKNSSFFLREFDLFYGGNQFCLAWFFDREKHQVQDLDFSKYRGVRFTKLVQGKAVSSSEAIICKKAHSKHLKAAMKK